MFQQQLEAYPRLSLAEFPTPLALLPRLSDWLGRPVYIKRDDLPGLALGGNKVRKLEYLLADALERGARKVVTFGGLQSNHACLTAAAARRVGLEPHLFFFERRPARLTGNLLLNQLFDARMHFIPVGGGDAPRSLEKTIRLVRWLAWLLVGPHYFIPVGGHTWRGCLGYVRAALELDEQARALGLEQGRVILAAGTGGTLAGLLAGFWLNNSSLRLLGIDVGKLWAGFPASIAHLAGELCRRLGRPHTFPAAEVPLLEATYVGPSYGFPSTEGLAAMQQLARLEGIVLDPIYTGKAFAGLLDLARQGQLGQTGPLIFLHTGGLPALFAHYRL
jgi:D-cysteine desulfhydrase family pyridoxal phosphate-dependent enzyme